MPENQSIEFKRYWIYFFSINYLFQGLVTSIFAVIMPIYMLILISSIGAEITASDIAFIVSIVLMPWAIKVIFGILSDRFGIKNFGRRKPWIIIPVCVSGLMWIILPFLITPYNVVFIITLIGIIISTGVAIGDTALDGLILDVCPREQLGRAQGTCWGFRSVGQIAGGPLLAFLIVSLSIEVNFLFIMVGILMIISSFLILVVKEPKIYERVMIVQNLKNMLTQKKDWKMYLFAIFNAFIDGVILIFISLYILIQMGYIASEGASLELLETTTETRLYVLQANITFIVGIGIIIGSIIGGVYSDIKSRRYSVYLALIITTVALIFMIIPMVWFILLLIACFTGLGMGWRHSSYSAVLGELAKRYPEMDSTYFSLANSFVNVGTVLGLSVIGLIFEQTGSFIIGFLAMALFNNLGLLPFLLLKSEDYELKKRAKTLKESSTSATEILKPEP
ncbi:MAG: MFS transporter [Promethearchaeota archaeon]|nr:MAG: MFS transporter [Candidatus Lokiarchaeota archaeon]